MALTSKTKISNTEIKRLFHRAISLSIILIQDYLSIHKGNTGVPTTNNMAGSGLTVLLIRNSFSSFISAFTHLSPTFHSNSRDAMKMKKKIELRI